PAIGALNRLEELTLTGNPLVELPAELGALDALRSLRLGGRSFEPASLARLPEALARLPRLEHLGLAHLPQLGNAELIERLPALVRLELHGHVTPAGLPA